MIKSKNLKEYLKDDNSCRPVAYMRKRILIAEDEGLSRRWLTAWLRDIGYDVSEAKDGVEALELLDTCVFDLVLSDIRMPRVDGIAVITHLHSISPDTPCIVLSASPNDADRLSGMLGAIVISKPFLLEDLESKIRFLLER
ncbi:MAG TPA: response regulator [Candidatus Binatia bacterium]